MKESMEIRILTSEEKKRIAARRRKIAVLSVFIVVFCMLSAVVGAYLYLRSTLEQMNYEEDPQEIVINTNVEIETEESEELEGTVINEAEREKIEQALQDNLNSGLISTSHVVNILLIGSDKRDDTWAGNSDAMILASINNNSREIVLTSIMRDTYVTIPNYGNNKVNLAHALGGAPYLAQTIEANFGIDINYYASVNFNSFISIIDVMGGIPMYVSPEEVRVANKYIDDMYREGNITEKGEYLPAEGGNLYLTGTQALAFSRIRYVGNSDYERTERQRRVLSEVVTKARSLSLRQLTQIFNVASPYVTHNIPGEELMNLVLMLPTLLSYEIVSDRIPYDGMYQMVIINNQDMLVPDWPATLANLYSKIYRNVSPEDMEEDAKKKAVVMPEEMQNETEEVWQ